MKETRFTCRYFKWKKKYSHMYIWKSLNRQAPPSLGLHLRCGSKGLTPAWLQTRTAVMSFSLRLKILLIVSSCTLRLQGDSVPGEIFICTFKAVNNKSIICHLFICQSVVCTGDEAVSKVEKQYEAVVIFLIWSFDIERSAAKVCCLVLLL